MSRRSRFMIGTFVVVVLLFSMTYAGAGALIYSRLSTVTPQCGAAANGAHVANTPAAFAQDSPEAQAFWMSDYEEVTFSSREDNLTLSAWYVEAEGSAPDSLPTVILVHGLNGCKRVPAILLPAGMLHRAGFNVLMIDLRDHGDSQIEDGRFAGGTEEFRDVLGAWDWLVNERGIAPERIGLFGTSLGAASVMMAAGGEPRVAAVWEDSGFADISTAIVDFLTYNRLPTLFAPAAPLVGRAISGDDISSRSPLAEIPRLMDRPMFIVHGDADVLMPVEHAYKLADAVRAQGGEIEPWIARGSGHVMAMFDYTDEYEQKLIAFFEDALVGS